MNGELLQSSRMEDSMMFQIDTQNVLDSLEVMGKGMLSIFVVIFILYLIVLFLTKVTNMKLFKKGDGDSEEE